MMPYIIILYNTKTGNTELMAKAFEEGAKSVEGIDVTLAYHVKPEELQNADALIIGAPTYNHRMMLDIQTLLEKAAQKNLTLKDKTAAAFGSYDWSGEASRQILEILQNKFQMKIIEPPILAKYRPDEKILKNCQVISKQIAESLLGI